MANLILQFLYARSALAWSLIDPNSTAIQSGVIKPNEIISLLIKSADWIFTIIGSVALLVFIAGGVMWLVSAGNSQLVDKGKQAMVGAAIGMGVVFLSFTMTDFVLKTFGYNRYSEWSTLPEQAEPQGVAAGAAVGVGAGTGITAPTAVGDPNAKADPNASYWSKFNYQTGIEKQIADASESLGNLLECARNAQPSGSMTISSISDSAGFIRCKTNYAQPPCAHGTPVKPNSCHYGGGVYNASQAADLVGISNASAFMSAVNSCGGKALNEGTHIHISTSKCPGT